MQAIEFIPSGVCSRKIKIQAEEGIIHSVSFEGGCSGNLKAISILVKGKAIEEVIALLQGIRCGSRATSCSDQLTKALIKLK